MGVQVHIATHPDALVGRLGDELARPVGGLFAPELVAVPSRGIERWLTQRIGEGMAERGAGDGICANVEFPSPSRLVRRVLEAVPDLAMAAVAWEGPALTAHLIETIDAQLDEPWMDLLARHLGDSEVGASRLAAAAKVSRLFSRYARRRPGMIRVWADGSDMGPDGDPLGDDSTWQPRLWRAVRDRIGVPSLPELLPDGLDPIRRGEVDLDLPERLAVYGLTSTDPLDLEVLVGLGEQRQVDLYVLHSSPALWEAVAASDAAGLSVRPDDPTAGLVVHPIVKAWGRDVRELQSVLAAAGLGGRVEWIPPYPAFGGGPFPHKVGDKVLRYLQADIALNREPSSLSADRSVQIHVCHGARRQVEVVRDAVMHVLADDPSLQPRDVVIMTPDLDTFAPLLESAFAGFAELRLRIADRAPAATNPLVAFCGRLLEVAGGRLEAGVVRELVDQPVVQNRFGFDTDTAASVIQLVDDAHVSWGLNFEHRQEWRVGTDERTWRRGLDRAMAGVFYADSPSLTVGGLAPLEGVEGQEAIPAGIVAALVDRLAAIREMTARHRPMSEWAGVIASAVRMLAAPDWGEEWQLDQLERLLAETFPAATADPEVTLADVRRATAVWTEDRPSPLHFGTGDITLCTLVPMRSVPYRVVALLGMDESRFPRRGRVDGDDLAADHELVGDTDPAGMDRQLLLDAVMAAGDHLLVTYSGRDELTNADLPPSVPIAELTDALRQMVGRDGIETILTRHPLQSFSPDNFQPGTLGIDGAWGFDRAAYRGALALAHQQPPGPVKEWPAPDPVETIRLSDLVRFLVDPPGYFVSTRLGIRFPDRGDISDNTLPADLDALGKWGVTDRLLRGLLAGHEPDELRARERGSDALPPGSLSDDDLDEALEAARLLFDAAAEHDYQPSRHLPYAGAVEVEGTTVEGTVTADPHAGHIATVTPSRIKAKQNLTGFAHLVYLSALHPEEEWTGLLLGRRMNGNGHLKVTFQQLGRDAESRRSQATELLSGLVSLYREGLVRPLPLPCNTGFAWQRKGGARGDRARQAGDDAFGGRFGESNDAAMRFLFAELSSFEALVGSEFVDLAERLWLPVLNLYRERRL